MSRVSRNVVYNTLGQGLGVLLSLVAVRIVFRRLGGDALGLIYFSVAFSAALSVAVGMGVCESAVREVASHHRERPDYIASLIRTSSLLYWIAYLILGLSACLLAPYLVHHWVKLSSLDDVTAIKMMRILTLGALLVLPGGLYRALLVGLQHMGLTNLLDVSGKAVQQGGIFVILLLHGRLTHVALWIAGASFLNVLVYWLICTRFFPLRALLLPGFSLAVVKENVGYASGLMTITLCSWGIGEMDKVMLSRLLPLALLGLYTFARGAINQGMLVTLAINNAIFPHFAGLHGAGEHDAMMRAYDKIQGLITYGTVLVFAAVPFAALPLFSRVFDMPSAHLLLLPATFLCIGYYMNGAITAPYVVSLAMGRPDITARQNLLALFIVPPVSVVTIYFFGLSGAGLSWVIYHIYTYSYGLPRICRECLRIAPHTWYWQVLRIMGSAFLIYGSAWAVLSWLGNFTLPALIAAYVAASLIYCAVAFGIMADTLRVTILDYVMRGIGRVQLVFAP